MRQAIKCDDADHAVRIIQNALGIESDDVMNYCFPQSWPGDREQRAGIIGEWLQTEARYPAPLLLAKHSPPDGHNYRPDISLQHSLVANRIWRPCEQFLRMPV